MTVGYSRPFGVVFLVLGGVLVVMNLLLLGSPGSLLRLIPAVICLVIGILYNVRPYFEVSGDTLTVPALLGPLKRSYSIARPTDLVFRGSKVFVRVDGVYKKVGIARWLADNAQWDAFCDEMKARGARTED